MSIDRFFVKKSIAVDSVEPPFAEAISSDQKALQESDTEDAAVRHDKVNAEGGSDNPFESFMFKKRKHGTAAAASSARSDPGEKSSLSKKRRPSDAVKAEAGEIVDSVERDKWFKAVDSESDATETVRQYQILFALSIAKQAHFGPVLDAMKRLRNERKLSGAAFSFLFFMIFDHFSVEVISKMTVQELTEILSSVHYSRSKAK